MCEWGDQELCLVPMPADLSHTGQFRWAIKGVDACIADLINALNAAGIYTANCCCGHGKAQGWIALHDGRTIWIDRLSGREGEAGNRPSQGTAHLRDLEEG